jgi:hypothetical protein
VYGTTCDLESGGAVEALFGAGALDDLVALAEAQPRTRGALLVPEARDPGFELRVLSGERGIVALGEGMEELGAAFRQPLDLEPDVFNSGHVCINDVPTSAIPLSPVSEEINQQNDAARGCRGQRDRVENGVAQA